MQLPMFNIREASEMLRVHPETLRRFIREGKINAVKVGKSKFIMEDEIKNFVKKCSCTDIQEKQLAAEAGK